MRRSRRGQMTIDYAIGAGVFLLAVAFVVAFIPGMIEPYEGIQRETVTSDRVATQLATGLLGDPTEPYLLDTDCTLAFFSGATQSKCRFSGNSLTERIGVDDAQSVDVRLTADLDGDGSTATLCWDRDGESLVEEGDAACDGSDTPFVSATSDPPTETGSVVVGRRIVSLANTDVTLLVRMW